MGVQEVPDDCAETMIIELDKQLAKLRNTANELNIPNANAINWTLIVSSTSDGASTQTKFTKLLQEYRKNDEEKFGETSAEVKEIVANKCGMHLGVNLRKAQNTGIQTYEKNLSPQQDPSLTYELHVEESGEQHSAITKREYIPIDTFVHAFCKLFGHVGTPEYGQGISFRDYIKLELSKPNTSNRTTYLNNVLNTTLERQVGSRYFVTAYNSARICFLYPAALEFLQNLTTTKSLNRLEQYVMLKLQDETMLHNLKIDGLFFYRIYADLTDLVKSNKLNKSVFDMNKHYLELLNFLEEVSSYPEQLLDNSTPVFVSETRLYVSTKLNIRHKHSHSHIISSIFCMSNINNEILLPRIQAAANSMKVKLYDL